MTRRILALSVLLSLATASAARAQSYPAYGGMPPGGMYSQGMMPPGMAGAPGMYGPQGMYGGPGMYPGMMPPQGGMNPGLNPQGAAYPDPMGPSAYGMQGHYQVPANAPPMKLPRGVTAENGLLYYSGKPYAENNGQQYNPYQRVSYDAPMEGGGPEGTSSVMSGGGMQGGPMPGYGEMQGYGQGQGYGPMPGGDCGCDGGDGGYCDNRHGGCYDCLYNLFHHGNPFPGKYGYMWTGGVDALAFNRDAGSNRLLVTRENLTTTEIFPAFNSNDFTFDFTGGGRAHLQLMGPSGIQYQAVYMNLSTLVSDVNLFGDNNLSLAGPIAGDPLLVNFFDADQMHIHYTSHIQGAEANIIYPFGNFQLLAGYRYLEIDEGFRLTAVDLDALTQGDFTADVFNQMHGGQIGILGQWELFGLINFDFSAKFGIFGDIVGSRQNVVDSGLLVFSGAGSESSVAYVTELGLVAVMPIGASFNVRCGYNAMFIDRVALAPDQLDFLTNPNVSFGSQVQQKGDLIVQGVILGIEAKW